jgi:hypothetical protein
MKVIETRRKQSVSVKILTAFQSYYNETLFVDGRAESLGNDVEERRVDDGI